MTDAGSGFPPSCGLSAPAATSPITAEPPIGLMDLPDECLVEIARFLCNAGVRHLAAAMAACRRLERVCSEEKLWRAAFAHQVGAPKGTAPDLLRPPGWSDEPWSVSTRRVGRPIEIVSGCVSLSVRSVWTDAFDPADGVAVWAATDDIASRTSCRHGPSAAVRRVLADYATHRSQCHVWLAVPIVHATERRQGTVDDGKDDRSVQDSVQQLSGGRQLWRPLRLVHAFNAAESIVVPWDWWWALANNATAPAAPLRAHFLVVDLWWIDPSDRTGVVPRCVAAAHRQPKPSCDGTRGSHPWYEADFALRHVVGCNCRVSS